MTTAQLTPRIGIDCRLSGRQHAGIGRYIENLVVRLPLLAPTIQWIFFLADEDQQKAITQRWPHLPENVAFVYAPVRHYSLQEQLKMPQIFQNSNLDVLHVPHFNVALLYSGKTVITIHDLLWHEYRGTQVTTLSGWKYWVKYVAYRFVATQAIKHAKAIVVPAETIRYTIEKFYPFAHNKIVVTKEGIPDVLKTLASSQPLPAKETPSTNTHTLVYLGSLYPHKNVKLVIDALSHLPHYRLLIIGTRTVFQDQMKKYVAEKHLENQVEFLGYVPDEQLLEIFANAFALVQPSFSEGFGLTGVEALAAGLPLLASDIPIFHEIYQDAAEYFNPHDQTAFVDAVHRLEQLDRAVRTQRIENGQKLAQSYNWDTMAQQTLEVYQHVLREK